jgi:GT2 family glycosyltransferase
MLSRRAGAPRLIDWTGERAVPWASDVRVVYEHYHRYLWARSLAAGRRVLDLGSGEGFGAALLAETAESVLGVDVDPVTVDHSRLNYGTDDLVFRLGDATDLSDIETASFDLVTAFELLEHIEDQHAVLGEIDRLLAPDGLLVLSTPERSAYAEASGGANPFHVRELTEGELRDLIAPRWSQVRMFGQRAMTGSAIEALGTPASEPAVASSFALECDGGTWREAGRMSPLYLLAVAGRDELPPVPATSTLADYGLELMRAAERRARPSAPTNGEPGTPAAEAARADAEREARVEAEVRLEAVIEAARRERAARDRETACIVRDLDAARYDTALADERREREVADRDAEIERLSRELRGIHASVTWRAFQRARGKVYGLVGGRSSLVGRAIGASLRTAGRVAGRGSGAVGPAAVAPTIAPAQRDAGRMITFPTFPHPTVSIVVPVYDDPDVTERCLLAILHATLDVSYEVVIVDDGGRPDMRRLLDRVSNAVILRNTVNLGYLRSVNRGSAAASGTHIVQLNNDTEPQPGWLGALVERMESDDEVGIVVPMLLFPDGTLQEAGSIVWRDGGAWNYGHGDDATRPAYGFARDVDYGSAAAMLVRGSLWREIGGYDERFGPGYYEDVDLCFEARRGGSRVVYEPRSRVLHVLGGSMGTDVEQGLKRYQVINKELFVEKWADALAEQLEGPEGTRLELAADRRRGSRVLVVDHAVPMPDQDAGSLRMFHLVRNLVDLGHRVTFLPDNLAAPQPYTEELAGLGVEVLCGEIDLAERLREIADETELAILSRPYVAARYLHLVRGLMPATRLAYDTVDLHYVRERRRAEVAGLTDHRMSDGFRELELGLARACDVTVMVSEEEARRISDDAGGVETAVVPLANPVSEDPPGRSGRSGVLFVGNFTHTPNVDAVQFLLHDIMPLVWEERPDTVLTVAGGNAPSAIRDAASDRVEVPGWVPDLDPLLAQSALMVAPLRYGAGVKGKVSQALAAGLPVVTTPLGGEGLGATFGSELLVGESAEEIAAQVVVALEDEALWARLSAAGQDVVRRTTSPECQREALRALLAGQDPRSPA